MKITHGLFVCMILTLSSAAWPDSAPVFHRGLDGSDVVLIKNQQVRMVREVVNIDCAWTSYSVQADFWFRNTTPQEQEVQFGFPIDYSESGHDWGDEWENVVKESKQSFKVEWRGKPVKYTLGKVQKQSGPNENRQWICWTAKFAPNEEVHHRIGYTFPTSHSSGGSKGEKPYANLTYVIKTGAAWQGPIESAIINIHYDHPLPKFFGGSGDGTWVAEPSELTFSPKGFAWDKEKKTATWEFKNFVPAEDIYCGWALPNNFGRGLLMVILFVGFLFVIFIDTITTVSVIIFMKITKRGRLKKAALFIANCPHDLEEKQKVQ